MGLFSEAVSEEVLRLEFPRGPGSIAATDKRGHEAIVRGTDLFLLAEEASPLFPWT